MPGALVGGEHLARGRACGEPRHFVAQTLALEAYSHIDGVLADLVERDGVAA